jgi:tetraacyldisaccharide 4'-kinase
MREPAFWYRAASLPSRLLWPFGALYGAVAASRMMQSGFDVGVPVLCIGNYHVGGAGKTPATLALVRLLREMAETPVVLSRGYGGALRGPVNVDPQRHSAADVGDEPLMMARTVPVVVARDRVEGAAVARSRNASVILMDDGFQNPAIVKDASLIVIDGNRGLGNGRVFPAGPLRAPMLRAHLVPDATALAALAGKRVLAFAGIGDPARFFATLRSGGIDVAVERAFADHHPFSLGEIAALVTEAAREGLIAVTTEKDFARLGAAPGTEAIVPFAVTMEFDVPARLRKFVTDRLSTARAKKFRAERT